LELCAEIVLNKGFHYPADFEASEVEDRWERLSGNLLRAKREEPVFLCSSNASRMH
jgi:hypothetical protein